jgi:hypothetical protein
VEIGYMNPDRWQHIADIYTELGMLPKGVTWAGFLYNADPASDLTWLYRVLGVAAGLLVLGAVIHFSLLTRERTRAEETIRKGEQRFRTMFEAALP